MIPFPREDLMFASQVRDYRKRHRARHALTLLVCVLIGAFGLLAHGRDVPNFAPGHGCWLAMGTVKWGRNCSGRFGPAETGGSLVPLMASPNLLAPMGPGTAAAVDTVAANEERYVRRISLEKRPDTWKRSIEEFKKVPPLVAADEGANAPGKNLTNKQANNGPGAAAPAPLELVGKNSGSNRIPRPPMARSDQVDTFPDGMDYAWRHIPLISALAVLAAALVTIYLVIHHWRTHGR